MGRRSRKQQRRRNRRKAKQSNWKRQPKTKMNKIGHGPNGPLGCSVYTGVKNPLKFSLKRKCGMKWKTERLNHEHERER
jgi:hypothetical protein